MIFLFAGHDTTGCSLAWCVLEIAQNPAVLYKLRQELDLVCPDSNQPIDNNQLNKCDYLWNVIREILRLWPVTVISSMRRMNRDLEFKNMLITKGSMVHISSFSIQRSNISRPDEFIPERWGPCINTLGKNGYEDERDKSILSFRNIEIPILNDQFLTFSAGKRNCIGQNMALLEMKLVLASFYRKFECRIYNNDNRINRSSVPDLASMKTVDKKMRNVVGNVAYDYALTMKPKDCYMTIHERIK